MTARGGDPEARAPLGHGTFPREKWRVRSSSPACSLFISPKPVPCSRPSLDLQQNLPGKTDTHGSESQANEMVTSVEGDRKRQTQICEHKIRVITKLVSMRNLGDGCCPRCVRGVWDRARPTHN